MQVAPLAELFEAVRDGREKRKVSLLIGAGCSVTAGIPVASRFVEEIRSDFPAKYAAAKELIPDGGLPNYQQCMARLAPRERQRLIGKYVDRARINWAHIGIACLVHAGIVDRVLTVNFDPLLIRACALMNQFPAVYDFAAIERFDASHVAERAIFYLHGQQSGFIQLHTPDQLEKHGKRLQPVFDDAGRDRLWIIIGYSGENDPVVRNLATSDSFANGLYWVGRPGTTIPKDVADLLTPAKSGFLVKCAGADEFFVELARHTECFPPLVFARPFSHLAAVYSTLVDEFPLIGTEGGTESIHPLLQPRLWINDAIRTFEQVSNALPRSDARLGDTSFLIDRFLAGDYQAVADRFDINPEKVPEEAIDTVYWSLLNWANALANEARPKLGPEADRLHEGASRKYAQAFAIKPNRYETLFNWANTLADHARKKTGPDSHLLHDQARKKYEDASVIEPNRYELLFNWGNTIADQARKMLGIDADWNRTLACEKYKAALMIKPDAHQAWTNWGNVLAERAAGKSGLEASQLSAEANEKLAAASALRQQQGGRLD